MTIVPRPRKENKVARFGFLDRKRKPQQKTNQGRAYNTCLLSSRAIRSCRQYQCRCLCARPVDCSNLTARRCAKFAVPFHACGNSSAQTEQWSRSAHPRNTNPHRLATPKAQSQESPRSGLQRPNICNRSPRNSLWQGGRGQPPCQNKSACSFLVPRRSFLLRHRVCGKPTSSTLRSVPGKAGRLSAPVANWNGQTPTLGDR